MNKIIEIFEPAMCCSTGLCGPGIDQNLLRISTVINALGKKNVSIKRFNLTSNTKEFVSNKVISDLLVDEGHEILPVTLVEGKVEKKGAYPSNEEFEKWTGISIEPDKPKKVDSGCCSDSTSCSIDCSPKAKKSEKTESCCGPKGCC